VKMVVRLSPVEAEQKRSLSDQWWVVVVL